MIRPSQSSPSAEWIAVQEEFEFACQAVQKCAVAVRAERAVHFVRPIDKFLPVSLLRYTLDEIASLSFADLRGSSGVGLVKIRNLAALLRRIADTPYSEADAAAVARSAPPATAAESDHVTEIEWRQWCSRISRHGLESEPIGRLIDRLADLPRSIWHTPLERYCRLSLEQLQDLKAYGRQRVRTVTATFRSLNQLLLAVEECPGLTTTLGSRLIASADAWVVDVMSGRTSFEAHRYLANVIAPVLLQIRYDVGDLAYGLLLERFSASFPILAGMCPAVRRPGEMPFSERYWTSRLRQCRQDAAAVVAIRWPRGADLCRALLSKSADAPDSDHHQEIVAITATLFPSLRTEPPERLLTSACGRPPWPEACPTILRA